jgi:hypothetical protein
MPISQSDALFQLVKSLTKSEKKHFRLYATRNNSDDSLKFIELFDLIDKQRDASDRLLFSKLKGISKSQYANLKRHLYSQVMTSLRLIHKPKHANIQVREYIDFAYILYGKGLYLQALQILKMAKKQAIKHQLNYAHLTIVEIEKLIENRHITRSGEEMAKAMIIEAKSISNKISNVIYLSNLRLELHALYLKNGHSRTKIDQLALQQHFSPKFLEVQVKELSVLECIYLYQSYVWYYYIMLDFATCKEYAAKWVQMLTRHPQMIKKDIDLHFRGYHYILSACFHLRDLEGLSSSLNELEIYRKEHYPRLNNNSQIISFLYVHTGRLNKVILSGDYQEGVALIPRTLRRINRYKNKIDDHKILVFYFKIAWIYFRAGDINKAMKYLNIIVNKEMMNLREDIQIYGRLLFLMCHYELENYDLLNYVNKSFKPFFDKIIDKYPLQIITQKLFSELAKAPKSAHKEIMLKYLEKLDPIREDQFQNTSFTYLDVCEWLRLKI